MLLLLILVASYLHITNGVFDMSVMDVIKTLLRIESNPKFDLVIFEFRLPRIVIAGLVGIGLGMAGVVLLSLKMSAQDFESAAIWMAGSIYNANWIFALTMLPWLLILGIYVHRKSYLLDYFQLEEDSITSLGIAVEKEKMKLLLASVGLVSACVSVSGSIGFIGLMAPHIAKQLVGIQHRYVMPVSALIGAGLLILADFIGKTVFAPSELAVGIVVSIIGIPYFLYLLVKSKA